jgi:arabinan endo-1,5-alpha-L-arabinosidase
MRSRSFLRESFAWPVSILMMLVMLALSAGIATAQVAPSHDPSRMIRNNDGRYWIFTTGDGVFAMSSPNADFSGWRVEPPVFPVGTWPSWINNYVSGFGGFFWAPDVIKVGSQYRLYYSCAGQGAPAAIGLATANNLAGPWTDQGLVVAGNNAIDPAPLIDGGNQWMTWGNWQTGIDLLQLNPSNGKALNSSRWDLVPGQVEAPYLHKDGSFYYLFFQRGLCCQGVNSGYTTMVARSSSVTGPYLDKNGVSVLTGGSSAGSVFLPNRDGRYIGPGHVGYGEGRLTYHFYDGQDNGAPKLRVTTMSFSNGWPVAGGVVTPPPPTPGAPANGTYKLRNRASGKYLDNLGNTADGANVAQWASGSSPNQRWVLTTSGGFSKLRAVTGGKYLDSIGRTADGSIVGQWANGSSPNQQWTIVATGSFHKLINRANGKAVDTGGQTADGAAMQMWFDNPSNNQQWTFEFISSSTSLTAASVSASSAVAPRTEASTLAGAGGKTGIDATQVLLNPVTSSLTVTLAQVGEKRVMVSDKNGLVWAEGSFDGVSYTLSTANIPAGAYTLRVLGDEGVIEERKILIKK